jgi:hypothetical protein
VRFACPACEAVFESGAARPSPAQIDCPGCGERMLAEADVLALSGDRVPTRPYDLAELKAQLEQEKAATPPSDRVWFVGLHGRSVGPLTEAGLEGLLARGQLQRRTLIWREGWPAWTAAETVTELRHILGLPRPAAPGEPPTLPEGSS